MLLARWQDMTEIWEPVDLVYIQSSPIRGFYGFCLRAKASVCILTGRLGEDSAETYGYSAPVYVGWLNSYHGWNGPEASWRETHVDMRWNIWRYYEIQNGI